MPKTKIVVLSDVHIGTDARTNWFQSSIHGPYLHTILDYVIANAADIRSVVLLGDVVDFWTYPAADRPPPMADIARAQPALFGPDGKFGKMVDALDGNVVYVIGNHDMGLTQQSVDLMTPGKRAIRFVGRAYEPFGDTSLILTHGNDFVMANAPDNAPRNPYAPLPIGYFVTRTVATYFIKKGLKPGQTVADLPNVGTPLDASYFQYFTKIVAELIKAIPHPWTISVAALLIDGLISSVGMTAAEVSPYTLQDGRQATMSDVHRAYDSLFSEWLARLWPYAAVMSLVNDLTEELGTYAKRVANTTGANVIVMGHTHKPVNERFATPNGDAAYVNSGFECASRPDLATRPPTFAVVEWNDASFTTRVLAVTGSSGALRIGEMPNLPAQTVARSQPLPPPGRALTRGSLFTLASQPRTRVSRMEKAYNGLTARDEFYPTLEVDPGKWVMLHFDGTLSGEPLRSGVTVQIRTIETTVAERDRLGAWRTPALYYSALNGAQPYEQEKWIVRKVDTTVDDVIHYNDAVYVENVDWKGQLLQIKDGRFLTTIDSSSVTDAERPMWFFREPVITPGDRAIGSGDPISVQSADRVQLTQYREEYAPAAAVKEYFPTLGEGTAVQWYIIKNGGGTLRHGDEVFVETRESGVGKYNRLGAFRDTNVYYYTPGYNQQRWRIEKLDSTHGDLRTGEPFALLNLDWNQYMTPHGARITTRESLPAWWFASL